MTFDHKVFPLDHGSDEKKATCETCHPNGTDTYTCFGCHEHTTCNVIGEHEGKSLAELQDCVRCHEGGRGRRRLTPRRRGVTPSSRPATP